MIKANIFSLAFSANNTHLYWYAGVDFLHSYPLNKTTSSSGTTDSKLYKYDIATLEKMPQFPTSPIEVFDDHADTIRDLTCHPRQNELIMTAR